MMMRYFTIVCLILTCRFVSGQTIRVLDRADYRPIEHVLVYNQTQKNSAITNRNGEATMRDLADTDTLVFQHASYQEKISTYSVVKTNRNQVLLSMRSIDLQQITVSAHRWEQKREDVPAKVTFIAAREAAFQNPQTAADLLGRTNEVFVQKSQLGGGSPMIRGFAANSVLIVVDGVRMNNAIYRSGNLHNVISLDPNFIEKTEIIFGPGSVMYGSDALGGVMVFSTVEPSLTVDDSLKFSVDPLIRYSSANSELSGNIVFKLNHRKWAGATSISYSNFGNLRTGSHRSHKFPDHGKRFSYAQWTGSKDTIISNNDFNIMKPSGYKQWNLSQKLRWKPSVNTDLSYGFHYSESSDIPRYDRLIEYRQNQLRFAEWFYGPQRWMMHNLQIRLLKENSFFDKGKIIAAYQFNEESRHDRRFDNLTRTSRQEKVHALILNADFQKQLSSSVDLFYGTEILYNKVISAGSTKQIITGETGGASTRYPDGNNHYAGVAAYGLIKKNFSEKFILHAGLRYSQVMLRSTLRDTIFYQFPFREINLSTGFANGSLGLTMHLTENIQLNANISSGFRAPNLDDTGKIFESEPGNVVVPNPGLKPEYAINQEIGFIYTKNNRIRAEVNAFYTLLFDFMVRRDFKYLENDSILYNGEMSKVQAIVNSGRGEIAGFVASIRFDLPKNLNLTSSITYTYGIETGQEERIPLKHIPPLFGATAINFSGKGLRIEASVDYNASKKWDDLDPSEQAKIFTYTEDGSLAWFTLNLRSSWQVLPKLQINAGVENILDKHYWPYASGIPAPGRNIYVALRGSF